MRKKFVDFVFPFLRLTEIGWQRYGSVSPARSIIAEAIVQYHVEKAGILGSGFPFRVEKPIGIDETIVGRHLPIGIAASKMSLQKFQRKIFLDTIVGAKDNFIENPVSLGNKTDLRTMDRAAFHSGKNKIYRYVRVSGAGVDFMKNWGKRRKVDDFAE